MKSLALAAMILVLAVNSQARQMRSWTWQELFEQADLVVIGQPVSTADTSESGMLPNILPKTDVVGLSTEFTVNLVMKGAKDTAKIVLHHYRLREDTPMLDGPNLTAFDPKHMASYLLFLKREEDGRYAPVSGQTDPAHYSIVKVDGLAR